MALESTLNTFVYILNFAFIIFVGWIVHIFLQMVLASWGHKRAKEKWIVLINTPFMQLIGIRWVSAIALVGSSVHLLLLIYMLLASLVLGRPIVLDN